LIVFTSFIVKHLAVSV